MIMVDMPQAHSPAFITAQPRQEQNLPKQGASSLHSPSLRGAVRPLSDHLTINERGSSCRGDGGRQHAQRGALPCSIGAQ